MGLYPKIEKSFTPLSEEEITELSQIIAEADFNGEFQNEQVWVRHLDIAVINGKSGQTKRVTLDEPFMHMIVKDCYQYRCRYALNHSSFTDTRKAELSKHLYMIQKMVNKPLQHEADKVASPAVESAMVRHDGPTTKTAVTAELASKFKLLPADKYLAKYMQAICGKTKPTWKEFQKMFVRQKPPAPVEAPSDLEEMEA